MSHADDPVAYVVAVCRPAPVSPLGQRVAVFLADYHGGLHNADRKGLLSLDWSSPHYVEYRYDCRGGELSTFDCPGLTSLVFLAHDHALRVEVVPGHSRYVLLCITPRDRHGSHALRHPSAEQALHEHRRHFSDRDTSAPPDVPGQLTIDAVLGRGRT